MKPSPSSLTALAFLLSIAPVLAHDPDAVRSDLSTPRRSVFLNPLLLPGNWVDVMVSLDDNGRRSFGFVGGIGWPDDADHPAIEYALGAQMNWYLFGSFDHGVQCGAQLTYSNIGHNRRHGAYMSGHSYSLVPYFGYKVRIWDGLTFQGQAGIGLRVGDETFYHQLLAMTGSTESGTYKTDLAALFNVGLGWSF